MVLKRFGMKGIKYRILVFALIPLLSFLSLLTPLFSEKAYAITQADVLNRARAWSILNALLDEGSSLPNNIPQELVNSCQIIGSASPYVGHHATKNRDNATWKIITEQPNLATDALASVGLQNGCRGFLEAIGYTNSGGVYRYNNANPNTQPFSDGDQKIINGINGKLINDAFFGKKFGDGQPGEAISYAILYYTLTNVCGWQYKHAYADPPQNDDDKEAAANGWNGTIDKKYYRTYTYEENTARWNTYFKDGGTNGDVSVGSRTGFANTGANDADIDCGDNNADVVSAKLADNHRFANAFADIVRPGSPSTPGTCKERYPVSGGGGGQGALEQQMLAACDEGFKNKADAAYCNKFSSNTSVFDACKYGQGTATGGANDTTPPESPNGEQATDETSCAVQAIGWIVCGVLNFMAGLVDGSYAFIEQLLKVDPIINSDGNQGLYKAWEIMRNFANIAFVIAFLIIIFSQITSIGITNYGIKKLLPRLVVAAILVNVSYWLCAIAVDLSNISGSSLKGLFEAIGASIPLEPPNPDFSTNETWLGIAGTILSITVGGGAAIYIGLSIFVPLLTACLVVVLTVVIILVIRQALIVLLIVVSPLAFVAYLLPNTESLYRRWFGLFQAMLLLYPIVSLIFGASALAAKIVQGS